MKRIFDVDDELVTADAGYPMAQLAYQTASKGLSGLEWAIGIPGSLGGIVRMNAGAHKRMASDVVESVRMVLAGGHLVTATHEELNFGYRSSAVPSDAIITAVTLQLRRGNPAEIHELIRKYNDYRTSTQPLREKSAGCIFKNPGLDAAGRLIQESGLKNVRIGGAAVSDVHANFIVNKDSATFEDTLKLIDHVKRVVRQAKGIDLFEEIIVWRFD